MKVFIVEDSAIIRGRIISLLSHVEGIEIAGLSGEYNESVKEIFRIKPGVIILDIRIVGGSGIEILKQVKSKMPESSVIVFTNYQYPQYIKKCKDLGAEHFLDKSKDFDKITNIISQMAV